MGVAAPEEVAIVSDNGQEASEPAPSQPLSIAFVATCPPRQCGIATFTSDLARALRAADPSARISWAAINEPGSIHPYGPEVRWRIRQRHPSSYQLAAEQLNASRVNVVNVQHEFGLYGIWNDQDESFEDHLGLFMQSLRKPLVTTLHTVLPDPHRSQREAVREIGEYSRVVVAMAEVARELLVERYGLEADKVRVVPHGVPAVEPRGRRRMKERLGLRDRTIISTFGLVDPRKGLEFMIRAMESVIERHPDALYLIVGKTHPVLVRQAGEAYRNELCELVEARGLEQHVDFVDEYLTQRQVVDYLLATDVYVTPYLDPNQITSGTLAYALGAGKAIVSTPYLHATETLADGRGILVGFRSQQGLAEAVLRILDDPDCKRQLEQKAYEYGHKMAWPQVGAQMLQLFRSVATVPERWPASRPAVVEVGAPLGRYTAASTGVALSTLDRPAVEGEMDASPRADEDSLPAAPSRLAPTVAGSLAEQELEASRDAPTSPLGLSGAR
jgi:glycosyltransferase involved in cell wall biosynthesis